MAVVIVAIGLLLYARFESELNRSIDDGLRGRVHALAALVAQQPPAALTAGTAQRLLAREDTLAQIIDPDGRIIAATTQVTRLRLLSARELAYARRGVVMLT